MKTKLLPLVAVAAVLAACGAPQTTAQLAATTQAAAPTYKVQAVTGAAPAGSSGHTCLG